MQAFVAQPLLAVLFLWSLVKARGAPRWPREDCSSRL